MDPLQIAGTITTATGLAAFVIAHVLQTMVRNDEQTLIDSLRSPRIPPNQIAKLLRELTDSQKIEGLKQMMGGEISAAALAGIARRQSTVQGIRYIGVLVAVLSIALFGISASREKQPDNRSEKPSPSGNAIPPQGEIKKEPRRDNPIKLEFQAGGWDRPAGRTILKAPHNERKAELTFPIEGLENNEVVTGVKIIKSKAPFQGDQTIDAANYVDISGQAHGRSIKLFLTVHDDPRSEKDRSWLGKPMQSYGVPFTAEVTIGTK